MTAAEVGQLVGTVGFPITACIALFWYMIRQDERFTEIVDKLRDSIDELRRVIERGVDDGR